MSKSRLIVLEHYQARQSLTQPAQRSHGPPTSAYGLFSVEVPCIVFVYLQGEVEVEVAILSESSVAVTVPAAGKIDTGYSAQNKDTSSM